MNMLAFILIRNKTVPNYVDKEWSLDGSNNVTKEEIWVHLGSLIHPAN